MLTASVNLIDGKLDTLIQGQQLILKDLLSLRGEVQTGIQSIHNRLLAIQDNQFRLKFAQLEEIYCEVLRKIGMCTALASLIVLQLCYNGIADLICLCMQQVSLRGQTSILILLVGCGIEGGT